MQSSKVSCAQCPQYQECSQRTRLFVNYCGSDLKRVKEDIRSATIECRARRGRLFSKGVRIQFQRSSNEKPVYAG